MGDINIDLLKYANHMNTQNFINNMFAQNFIPLITKPTRITPHSATLLDHIYTNTYDCRFKSGIIVTDISDHFGTFYVKTSKKQTKNSQYVIKRQLHDQNIADLRSALLNTNYTEIYQCDNPDTAYSKFIDIFKHHYNMTCPLKEIRLTNRSIKRDPWITQGIIVSSARKQKLLNKKLKSPSDANIKIYNTYLSMLSKIIRSAKYKYYKDKLFEYKNNMRMTWNTVNQILQRSRVRSELPSQFSIHGVETSDKVVISENFNKYFANIAVELNNKIPKVPTKANDSLNGNFPNSLFFDPVTAEELISVSNSFNNKSSSGHDDISMKTLKKTIDIIVNPLVHILIYHWKFVLFPLT